MQSELQSVLESEKLKRKKIQYVQWFWNEGMGEIMSCRRDQQRLRQRLSHTKGHKHIWVLLFTWFLSKRWKTILSIYSFQFNLPLVRLIFPLLPSEVIVYFLLYCNVSFGENKREEASVSTWFLVTSARIFSFFPQALHLQNCPLWDYPTYES